MLLVEGVLLYLIFFFADDLLLLGEASVGQMHTMLDCLNLFCEASGEMVSTEKTRMLVSKNVNHNIALELRDMSQFLLIHCNA